MTLTAESIVARADNVVFRVVDDQAVIVEPDTSTVTVVSDTGSSIWALLDGQLCVSDIADAIANEYDTTPDIALADIIEFLSDLQSKALISMDT
jgi:hypothetical protein